MKGATGATGSFRSAFAKFRQMFEEFDATFDTFDAAFDDLDREAEDLKREAGEAKPGETVTTRREEVRADGTRVVTTITRSRR
jgi:hypothetical protein